MRVNKLLNTKFKNNHLVSNIFDNINDIKNNSILIIHNVSSVNFSRLETFKNITIIINKKDINKCFNINFNTLTVNNTKKYLGKLLKIMYSKYLNNYKIIGITGTNGKTSSSYILYNYLKSLNYNVILYSSIGIFMDGLQFDSINTTPSLITIYRFIVSNNHIKKIHKNKKTNIIIIECSSQGIRDNRLFGINFDIIGFTNITSDHLDYHLNYSDYLFSKCLLFNHLHDKSVVLLNTNIQDLKLLDSICPVDYITYGKNGDYELSINSDSFIINHQNKIILNTNLLGDYQKENITLVYAILNELHISLDFFKEFVTNLYIPGRGNSYLINNYHIVIDYAHTIDATRKVFEEVNKLYTKVIVIVGCGGNRDRYKRSQIGEFITSNASYTIFTEDNNRSESFDNIIKDILKDVKSTNYTIIQSRYDAILYSKQLMDKNSCLLILGKGIEKTKYHNKYLTDLDMVKEVYNV